MNPDLTEIDSLWSYDAPEESEERFRALLPAAQDSGNLSYLTELLTQIARAQGLQGRFETAHQTLDKAEASPGDGPARPRIRYLLDRGRVFNSSGSPGQARDLFLQAWHLAREAGEDYYAADAAHMMGIVEPAEQQLEWSRRALEIAERSDDPRTRQWLGSLHNNMGWTYHDLGRYEEALAHFQRGLEWREEQGQPREIRIAAWAVARALRSLGRYEEALTIQRENLQQAQSTGDTGGYVQEEIGECLLALARGDEAREHFSQAYAVLSGDPWLAENEPERLARLKELSGC
jgi:tetratricopeptide (TPR) repeat protein